MKTLPFLDGVSRDLFFAASSLPLSTRNTILVRMHPQQLILGTAYSTNTGGSCAGCRIQSARTASGISSTEMVSLHCADVCAP